MENANHFPQQLMGINELPEKCSPAASLDRSKGPSFLPALLAVIPCLLINIDAVYKTLAYPILLGLPLFSFFSPYSGLVYLTATQIIPDLPGFPLTNAELAVPVWFFVTCLRKILVPRKVSLEIPRPLIFWVAPFLGWLTLCSLTHGDWGGPIIVLKCAMVSIIAWNLISETKGRYDLCLLAILLACTPALVGFWGHHLGVKVYIPEDVAFYMGDQRGALRIGSGRGDSNTIYPFLVSLILGFLSFSLTENAFTHKRRTRYLLYLITGMLIILGIPAILGTMSRGAIVCLFISIAVLLWFLLNPFHQGAKIFKNAFIFFIFIAISSAILLWSPLAIKLQHRAETLISFWKSEGALGKRLQIQQYALDGMWDSPVFGMAQKEYFKRFTGGDRIYAHNTFLDTGVTSGFPGLFLSIMFFSVPFFYLIRVRKYFLTMLPGAIVYFNWIVYGQSIAALNNKVTWILWCLFVHQLLYFKKIHNGSPPNT